MTKGKVLNLSEVTLDPAQIRHICFEGHGMSNDYTFEILLSPRGSIKYTVNANEYEEVQAFAQVNALS